MYMRNYKKEYDNYHSKPEQKLRRAARNAARKSIKDTPKGKDVHHKDNNPMNNDKDNLSVVSQNYNRKEPRLREKKLKENKDIKQALKKVKGITKKQVQLLLTLPPPVLTNIINQLSVLTMSEVQDFLQSEEMGTTTGAHIAGTGDDSSTVVVRKKKQAQIQKRQTKSLKDRIKDMAGKR